MRKIKTCDGCNERYVLSKTDITKIKAHTRSIAKKRKGQYSGSIHAYFDSEVGDVFYEEFVGSGGYISGDGIVFVYAAPVYEF